MTALWFMDIEDQEKRMAFIWDYVGEYFDLFFRYMREGHHDQLMLGPVIRGGHDRHFYFLHLSGRIGGTTCCRTTCAASREAAEGMRYMLWKLAIHDNDGLVVHQFDDTTALTKMINEMWPRKHTSLIRSIKQDRRDRHDR